MKLWNDGRSGEAGCLAGNLVLAHLRDTQGESFSERKGTTFRGRTSIWVGRVCSTDAYLNARDRQATFGLAHSSSGAIVIACKPIAVPWLAQKAKRWGLELIQAWRRGAHSTIAGCDPLSGRTTDGSRG